MLMFVAAPAFSGGTATQMWKCQMDEDIDEAGVRAKAAKWLAAAKTMKGGKNLHVNLLFPVAVNNAGELDFMFVVTAPTFAEWGMFWDGYAGSAAAAADKKNDLVDCPDSAVWESYKLK